MINAQRRNNPEDMTVTEHLHKIKEEICDNICKSREKGGRLYSQEQLDEVCEHDCPLRKL